MEQHEHVKQNASACHGGHCHSHQSADDCNNFWAPIFIMISLYLIAFGGAHYFQHYSFIFYSIVTIAGLLFVGKKTIQNFSLHTLSSIEFLMMVAAIGALFIGAVQESAFVIILFMAGEALEGYTAGKARSSVQSLSKLIPDDTILVTDNGERQSVNSKNVNINDKLEIKAGVRFPVDGIILEGTSQVDESLLSGEPLPISKTSGQSVVAGSINISGKLIIKATKVGNDHFVARLGQLVKNAQSSKTKIMRLMEKFSSFYTPFVFFCAIGVAVAPPLLHFGEWQTWIYRGLSILLIGCPCALLISTPSAIAAGITALGKRGVLVKTAQAIELLSKVKTIAFDKTGTLTQGKIKVTDVVSLSEFSDTEILSIATSLELGSNHPLAKAVCDYAKNLNVKTTVAEQLQEIAGQGVVGFTHGKLYGFYSWQSAKSKTKIDTKQESIINKYLDAGKSLSVLLLDENIIGVLAFQDTLKWDSKDAIRELRKMGYSCIMLTGDHMRSAASIGENLGIEVYADLKPEEKLVFISRRAKNSQIAMVGDGINDAPALCAASVGIAMGSGANVSVDAAQVVIAQNHLSSLVDAVKISRKTLQKIWQNILFAVGIKVAFLILTVAGDTSLWMAVLADTGATIIVTLNAMTILLQRKIYFSKLEENKILELS